jgi:phosphatidylserine decarboxylase
MASSLPGLFHLNERVCWLGKWRHGFFSMTAVGATNVGSIHAAGFDPDLRTNQAVSLKRECVLATGCSRRNFYFSEKVFADPVALAKGQEFGHFEFGSTIVLLFEAPRGLEFAQHQHQHTSSRVLTGQGLALS